jgi:hypothetical protein
LTFKPMPAHRAAAEVIRWRRLLDIKGFDERAV